MFSRFFLFKKKIIGSWVLIFTKMLLQKYCSLLKDLSIAIDDDIKIISIKLN